MSTMLRSGTRLFSRANKLGSIDSQILVLVLLRELACDERLLGHVEGQVGNVAQPVRGCRGGRRRGLLRRGRDPILGPNGRAVVLARRLVEHGQHLVGLIAQCLKVDDGVRAISFTRGQNQVPTKVAGI